MDDIKNKLEAVLYTTGRSLDLAELSRLCGVGSIGIIKDKLKELYEEYNKRGCALEILEENDKWRLNIKKEYLYLTEKLLNDAELDRPCQETLAVIAYKNPVLQSDVIKIRGNTAYDHIKILFEMGFIVSEKSGRTRIIKLTPKFYDYFDVVDDTLRSKMDGVAVDGSQQQTIDQSVLNEEKNKIL